MRRMVIACVLLGACARTPAVHTPSPAVQVAAVAVPVVSCARRTEGSRPARIAGARQGNAVALVRAGDGLLAYVADADSRSVHTVDVDAGKEIARTRVEGEPRQLVVLDDGRVAVTLSDGARIAVLEPAADPASPLAAVCTREVPAEPWGVALSADDAKLVVTSAWGSALTVLDAKTLDVQRVVPLPRDPRGVLVEDGVAFVAHAVGAKMSAVDLDGGDGFDTVDLSVRKSTPLAQHQDMLAVRTGSQGYALASVALPVPAGAVGMHRLLEPMVSVDPGDPERRSSVYYGPPFDGVAKQTPFVAAVDPDRRQALGKYLLGTSETNVRRECLLPRAAAVRDATASLFVACLGIDAVLELDALAADPFRAERRRFDVPPGPEGLAVDDASARAVVFSQIGAAVTVIPLDGSAAPKPIALDYHPDPALAASARGRQLFYRTDDARISGDGIGCSSCHLDGRDDGITWTTPMGPRQTPMLAGRLADTAPYGWEGDRPTLADYIGNTVVRLGGHGLDPQALDDLAKYLLVVRPPPARDGGELARRGRDVFDDPGQGCARCHAGGETDGVRHAVSTNQNVPQPSFDTPSLRFVRGTAPYFHDGRYPTLEALLADPASGMGYAASLPEGDRAALAAYLRTL